MTGLYAPFIEAALAEWGLVADCAALDGYLAALAEKNAVMNLTAIKEPREMALRHVVDSLALLKLGLVGSGRLIDVGTGGGTPGVPLAIALPALHVVLNDPMKKRCAFLRELAAALPNAEVQEGRAEQLAVPPLRESFDFATARAVAPLNQLAEYCLPLVCEGGLFLPMKSATVEPELLAARNAIATLGGRLEEVLYYEVPGEGVRRCVPVIRKVKPTAAKYPRATARIVKAPL